MSRPNSSAPRRNLAPGGARFSMRLCLAGSRGASHGASAAAPSSAATSTRPTTASRFRRNCRQARLPGAPSASRGAAAIATAWLAISALSGDARVERAVGEVHEEVDEDEGQREDQHRTLEKHVVAREDRLDHEAAEPRPGEYRLGEDGAAHELAGLESEQGEHGNGGVAERVL